MFNWLRKQYLLSYAAQKFQSLNSTGTCYDLKVESVYIFGFRSVKTETVSVGYFNKIDDTKKYWDKLIVERTPIN